MSEFVNREDQQPLPFKSLIPSWNTDNGSLVETQAFRLLYDDPANLQHFKDTKQPLPLDRVLNDNKVVYAISASEPGKAAHYAKFRNNVEKLRPTHASNNRRLFESADSFIAELNTYLHNIIQFIIYDVYLEILKKYYDPWSDIELYDKLAGPVNIHLVEAEATDNDPQHRLAMQNQWIVYRDAAVQSTQHFLPLKQSSEVVSMLDAVEYGNENYEEEKEVDRVTRANRADFESNEYLRHVREQNPLIWQWEMDEQSDARMDGGV